MRPGWVARAPNLAGFGRRGEVDELTFRREGRDNMAVVRRVQRFGGPTRKKVASDALFPNRSRRRRHARRRVGAEAGTLDTIKARGALVCGSNPGLAGFALPDDQGVYKGLDVDECRALAAAIFNDANKVKFLPINAKDRPTILASGEIDVLDPEHHLDDVARDRRHVLHRRQLLRRARFHGEEEARRRIPR